MRCKFKGKSYWDNDIVISLWRETERGGGRSRSYWCGIYVEYGGQEIPFNELSERNQSLVYDQIGGEQC